MELETQQLKEQIQALTAQVQTLTAQLSVVYQVLKEKGIMPIIPQEQQERFYQHINEQEQEAVHEENARQFR